VKLLDGQLIVTEAVCTGAWEPGYQAVEEAVRELLRRVSVKVGIRDASTGRFRPWRSAGQ
jgi:hypothetical protein